MDELLTELLNTISEAKDIAAEYQACCEDRQETAEASEWKEVRGAISAIEEVAQRMSTS